MPPKILEIVDTPNPNARKIILDQTIAEQPISFLSPVAGSEHEMARQLFSIKGVTSILMLGDFVTVNKEASAKWGPILKRVRKILEEI